MASYEVELMRRKQKLSWDIFSHGLHLKASLPGKRIRTAPSWHQKGGSRPVAENSGTFYSPNPPFIYHWKLGHGGGGGAPIQCTPPRTTASPQELHFFICQSGKYLLCPSHAEALGRVLKPQRWTKPRPFSERPHSTMGVTAKDKRTHIFRSWEYLRAGGGMGA